MGLIRLMLPPYLPLRYGANPLLPTTASFEGRSSASASYIGFTVEPCGPIIVLVVFPSAIFFNAYSNSGFFFHCLR